MTLVVANKYKLTIHNGKFDKGSKKLDRKDCLIEERHAIESTREWESTGVVYEIDDKKTEEARAALLAKKSEHDKDDLARAAAGSALANMAIGVKADAPSSRKVNVDDLEEYCKEMSDNELEIFFKGEKRKGALKIYNDLIE